MSTASDDEDLLNAVPDNEHRLKLPGFGLPVNHAPPSVRRSRSLGLARYPDAVTSWACGNLTLREIAMMGVMNELSDKPDWAKKVFDESIVEKWRKEALAQEDFTEQMFNFVRSLFPHSEH